MIIRFLRRHAPCCGAQGVFLLSEAQAPPSILIRNMDTESRPKTYALRCVGFGCKLWELRCAFWILEFAFVFFLLSAAPRFSICPLWTYYNGVRYARLIYF